VSTGGRAHGRPQARARATSEVAPIPRTASSVERLDLHRFIPSGRSLGAALLITLAATGALLVARDTGVFAVRTIDVAGAPPTVAAQVRRALAPTRGTSLLKVDLGASRLALQALPMVASARFDRAYPHTLRVVVVPERPVAVVRQGGDSYLVAESGSVIAAVDRRARPALARIWVPRSVRLQVGAPAEGNLRTAVDAVAPLAGRRFPGRVGSVTVAADALTLRLRSGLELRLGDAVDVPLKLAVAARVIPLLDAGTVYLDVTVPERPVSGTLNSQVEV
jgi:cell division protein FtsQ